jgi:hypothetical protein
MQTVLILGLVSLFTDISSEMAYPLLSLYLTTTLGATPAIVGIIEGIAESLASLLKTYSGYLSDRTQKRKPLALLGYGSATIGKLFLYSSTSWKWVLTGRMVDRFGKGVRTAPRDALIAEASQANQLGHSFGLHRTLDTLGAPLEGLPTDDEMSAWFRGKLNPDGHDRVDDLPDTLGFQRLKKIPAQIALRFSPRPIRPTEIWSPGGNISMQNRRCSSVRCRALMTASWGWSW